MESLTNEHKVTPQSPQAKAPSSQPSRYESLYNNALKKGEQKQKLAAEVKKAKAVEEMSLATFHPHINDRSKGLVSLIPVKVCIDNSESGGVFRGISKGTK